MGRLRYGRYETLGLIASGGMASVHLGRARGPAGFERLVAIKVMHQHIAGDPEFSSMFLDEARLAAQIRHPNVVPTLDVSEDGRIIVMEYVEGAALSSLLRQMQKQGERVPLSCTLRIVLDVLDGLHAAHELRGKDGAPLHLVHRDISPHNVLVGVDGISRITDFGIAFAESRLTSTRGSQLKGKMPYMAPEQLEGLEVDRKVDVYAAGVVLWELLVGRRLFTADNDAALACRVLAGPERSPRQIDGSIPAAIDRVAMKALARRDGRFASALDFAEELEAAASESAVAVARPRSVSFLARQAQTAIAPPPSSHIASDAGRVGAGTTQPGHGDPVAVELPPETVATRASAPGATDGAAGAARSVATQTAAPRDEESVPAARPFAVGAAEGAGTGQAEAHKHGRPAGVSSRVGPAGTIAQEPAPSTRAAAPEVGSDDRGPTTATPVLGSPREPRAPPTTLVSEDGAARGDVVGAPAGQSSTAQVALVEGASSWGSASSDNAPGLLGESGTGSALAVPSSGYEHTGTGASLVAPIPGLPRRSLPAWLVASMLGFLLLGGVSAWWLVGRDSATDDAPDAAARSEPSSATTADTEEGASNEGADPTASATGGRGSVAEGAGAAGGPSSPRGPRTSERATPSAPGAPVSPVPTAGVGGASTPQATTTASPAPSPPSTTPPAGPTGTDPVFHPPHL